MAESTLQPPGGEAPAVFLRRATGLVRELNLRDVLVIDLLETNPFGNLAALFGFMVLFTGADLALGMATGVLAGMGLVLIYAMLAHAMPRSGGDYLFISRVLHPAPGFVGSWTMMLILAFFSGYNGFAICNYLLPNVLAPVGVATGNHSLVTLAGSLSTPPVETVAVLLTTWLYFLVGYWGMRPMMRLMWVPIAFTVAAVIIGIPFLLVTDHGTFVSAFNSFAANFHTSATGLEQVAAKAGTPLDPPFSWSNTLAFWPWALYIVGYSITSVAVSGEIRNATRAQYIGVIGSTIVGGFLVALLFALGTWKLGKPLINAVGYVIYANPAANPLPFPPYPHLLMGLPNLLVLLIISGAVLTNIYFTGPLLQMWGTRYIFAWAIDRVAPPWAGTLAGARNAPVGALAVMAVFTAIFGLALIYVPNFSLASTSLLQNVVLLLAGLTAVVFPWRKPDLYRAAIKWEVGGIPVITLLGLWAIAYNVVMVYYFVTNSGIFGTFTSVSEWFAAILVLSGLAYYIAAYLIARSRGIDVGLAYREIPPE